MYLCDMKHIPEFFQNIFKGSYKDNKEHFQMFNNHPPAIKNYPVWMLSIDKVTHHPYSDEIEEYEIEPGKRKSNTSTVSV